jgi:pimeloyl-ACP methyl ester carboxylesterase
MYLGVGLILFGWALGFRSPALLGYAAVTMGVFHLRVLFGEEAWLDRRHRDAWRRYKSRVPRWLFPSRRALVLTIGAVLLIVPAAGLVYEAYVEGEAAREFPPPGRLVDIGGRKLHLVCIGEGAPTVMFEASGFGTSSQQSATVREQLARRVQVCSYDRMGMGWSDPGPRVVTAGELARQLAVLQDRADLRGPFVLVGSSIGGLIVEMYARQYPDRVAGLVFLDAATSGLLPAMKGWFGAASVAAPVVTLSARIGVFRLMDPFHIPTDTDEGRRSAAMTYATEPLAALAAIARGASSTEREFAAAPPLRDDIPLAVLSADSDRELWVPPGLGGVRSVFLSGRGEVHQQLAKRSTKGSWQLVPKSTHLIASSQPDVVVKVVASMLETLK